MARIYPDSKTFVDKKLLFPEPEIINRYHKLKNQTGNPSVQQLKKFIDENFVDDELEVWAPPDFKEVPSIVNTIEDETFKRWVMDINQIWKDLGVKVPEEVKRNPELHSILYVPNGFIKVRLVHLAFCSRLNFLNMLQFTNRLAEDFVKCIIGIRTG